MNKKLVLALMLAASVAACQKKDDTASTADLSPPASDASHRQAAAPVTTAGLPVAPAVSPVGAPTAGGDATSETVTVAAPDTTDPKPLTVTAPDLAYAYDYSLEAPARDVPHLVRQHEAECSLAGSTVCQVVGATTKSIGEDDVSGRLEIRARPEWIARFRDRIEDDAKALGGKVSAAETGTDDLSRSLVDTQAAIRAKTELRDRLETLLKTHRGKLDDLVALEQQLAEVQGDIDQAQSELAVMKTRVQTATLVIEYRSMSVLAPDSAFRPLAQAAHGFTRHVMAGFAVLLNVISVLLPFGAVAGGGLWIFLKRRKPRPAPQPTTT